MRRAVQPVSRRGARRQPRMTIEAASTAAERRQALTRPLEEAKV
jgi:hypothetical protein